MTQPYATIAISDAEALGMYLGGGPMCRCDFGHKSHPVQIVDVDLSSHAVPDVPTSVGRFMFETFTPTERTQDGYCVSMTEPPMSVISQGIWEGYETALTVAHLRDTSGLVVDMGCEAGWFSMLAGMTGHPVLAMDCDHECVTVCRSNGALNGYDVRAFRGFIDADTPAIGGPVPMALLKTDLEGNDHHAVRVFADSFRAKVVGAALIEVSPVFCGAASCQELIDDLYRYGYECFWLPPKGTEFGDPLNDVRALVASATMPEIQGMLWAVPG